MKALYVQGEFFDSFGEVIVRQVWTNNHVNPVTSKYKFSLDTSAVVSGFEMKIGNQSWTGVVKEKSTARENFDEAVASGKKSSILEKISDNEYQVEIGPIPPSETAELEFHYLTHAAVQLDGSFRFVLPTNIAPKYINPSAATNQVDKEYAEKMAATPYASQPPYTFDVDLTWRTGSALRGIVSATNEIHTELLSATAVRVRCTTAPENGDFSLLVTTASTTGTYSYQNEEGTTFLYVHNQIPTEVVPSSVSAKKITIVVDRSGSMEWQKISEAVAAIDKFLSLLSPNADTLINVVSFGSHFDALYSHSVPATAENIDKIRQSVRTFQADYGGTELSRCLKAVAAGGALPSGTASEPLPDPVDMEHVIVLLTDGQVYNVHEIMTYLSEQKTTTNFRIMSVGIGRDADRKLVEQVADTTHGLSRMLTDETDLTRALTDILAYIDKQYYTDVKVLDHEASQCSQVLYPAHPVDMFLRLSPAQYQQVVANGLTISAKDPVHRGSMKVWHLPVDKTVKAGRLLEKLYADHTISQLSTKIQDLGDNRFSAHPDVAHLTESIVGLSVKHGIMNKHTSFLVISNEKIDPDQQAKVQHVEVPQHEDYPHGPTSVGGIVLLAMAGSTSPTGGSISLSSGSVSGSSSISISGGSSAPGVSGSILLRSGAGSVGDGSDINFNAGGGSSWDAGGDVTFTSGSSSDADARFFTGYVEYSSLSLTSGSVYIATGAVSEASGSVSIATGAVSDPDVILSSDFQTVSTPSGLSDGSGSASDLDISVEGDTTATSGSVMTVFGGSILNTDTRSISDIRADMHSGSVTVVSGASFVASGGLSPAIGSLSDPGSTEDVSTTREGSVAVTRGAAVEAGQIGENRHGFGPASDFGANLNGKPLNHISDMSSVRGASVEVGEVAFAAGSLSDFSPVGEIISVHGGDAAETVDGFVSNSGVATGSKLHGIHTSAVATGSGNTVDSSIVARASVAMIMLSTGAATSGTRGFVGYLSSTGTSAHPRGGAVYIQVGDKDTDAEQVDIASKGASPAEPALSDSGGGAVAEAVEKRGPPLIPGGLISPDGSTVQMTFMGGAMPSENAHTGASAPVFHAGMIRLSTGAASTGNTGYIGLARDFTIPTRPDDVRLQVGGDLAPGSESPPEPLSFITVGTPLSGYGAKSQGAGEIISRPESSSESLPFMAVGTPSRDVDFIPELVMGLSAPQSDDLCATLSPDEWCVMGMPRKIEVHADAVPFEAAKKPVPVGVFEHAAQWVHQHTSELFIVCILGAALALLLDAICCAVDDK